jgi:hypothetical protein
LPSLLREQGFAPNLAQPYPSYQLHGDSTD